MEEELHIGQKVRDVRTERRLTMQQLADKAGLSLTGIHMIETEQREPTSSSVLKLARALDVDPGELFGAGETAGKV